MPQYWLALHNSVDPQRPCHDESQGWQHMMPKSTQGSHKCSLPVPLLLEPPRKLKLSIKEITPRPSGGRLETQKRFVASSAWRKRPYSNPCERQSGVSRRRPTTLPDTIPARTSDARAPRPRAATAVTSEAVVCEEWVSASRVSRGWGVGNKRRNVNTSRQSV